MRKVLPFLALLAVALVAGCGGSSGESEDEGGNEPTHAACDGSALTKPLKLPSGWPQIEEDKMVYTEQETNGPTDVVEGYFNGRRPGSARRVPARARGDRFHSDLRGGRGERLRGRLGRRGPHGHRRHPQRMRRRRENVHPHHEPRRIASSRTSGGRVPSRPLSVRPCASRSSSRPCTRVACSMLLTR